MLINNLTIRRLLFYFSIFGIFPNVFLHSENDSQTYIGAVVQYYPKVYPSNLQMVQENANNYQRMIEAARHVNADIIVFPEFGLTSFPIFAREKHFFKSTEYKGSNLYEYAEKMRKKERRTHKRTPEVMKFRKHFREIASKIPSPDENVIPCDFNDAYAKSLRMMSCAARNNSIYVVVNHYEFVDCNSGESCPADGFLLHNANVAFDRKGRVVARYRKQSLHYEPWADSPPKPEFSSFETDFNVTFAQLVSLDLMLRDVPYSLKRRHAWDVVYSTYVFDEVPFLSTVQDQALWAYKHQMKLLASGFSRDGSSDIYLSKNGSVAKRMIKPRVNYMMYTKIPRGVVKEPLDPRDGDPYDFVALDDPETELSQNSLPKSDRFLDREDNLERHFDVYQWESKLLDEQSYAAKVCAEQACCYIVVKLEYDRSVENYTARYSYRAIAFSKVYQLGDGSLLRSEFCGIVACSGNKLGDCGRQYSEAEHVSPATFHTLMISHNSRRNFTGAASPFFAPITSAGSAAMDMGEQFFYKDRVTRHSATLTLHMLLPTRDLEVFGLNGKIYDAQDWRLARDHESPITLRVIGLAVILVISVWMVAMSLWNCWLVRLIKRENERVRQEAGVAPDNDETLPMEAREVRAAV